MQLHAVRFPNRRQPGVYERMAAVLRASVAENSPTTPLTIHEIAEPDDDIAACARPVCKPTWIANARKAKHHNRIVQEAADGGLLCLIDADTMVLGDLSEIESLPFDLAYTVRPPGQTWKLNTGVYFLRASDITKSWMIEWRETCKKMLGDVKLHEHWKTKQRYGGTHQAALGFMLAHQQKRYNLDILELPCAKWNCVSGLWQTADNPKVVHIMGQMRNWCFGRKCPNANAKRLVQVWKAYDAKCGEVAA